MRNRPIGIFDSGVGGLSVWKEVVQTLPHESIIYYADSANCPYGSKPPEETTKLALGITDFLLARTCKLIIVACNTATAASIDTLRSRFDIPFVGMEPAVKPAARNSMSGNIGILATAGTLKGRLYQETCKKYASNLNVHVQAGHGLVEIVEAGNEESSETAALLKKYIGPMLAKNIDQLVLGCTHYPFLSGPIKKITGSGVTLHNPAEAIAAQTRRQLEKHDLKAEKADRQTYRFYTSGDPSAADSLLSRITGKKKPMFQKR